MPIGRDPDALNEWGVSPLTRLSHSVMKARSREVMNALTKMGIPVNPSNRLAMAWKDLDQYNTVECLHREDVRDRLAAAMHAVFQAVAILEACEEERRRRKWNHRPSIFSEFHLRQLVKGPFPPTRADDGRPADHRFEAFVGAQLLLSSLTVTRGDTIGGHTSVGHTRR